MVDRMNVIVIITFSVKLMEPSVKLRHSILTGLEDRICEVEVVSQKFSGCHDR